MQAKGCGMDVCGTIGWHCDLVRLTCGVAQQHGHVHSLMRGSSCIIVQSPLLHTYKSSSFNALHIPSVSFIVCLLQHCYFECIMSLQLTRARTVSTAAFMKDHLGPLFQRVHFIDTVVGGCQKRPCICTVGYVPSSLSAWWARL
jgi:hypothetical protein